MKLALALAYQRPSDRRWTPTAFSNLQCPEFSKSTAVSTSDGGTKASCERSRLQALPMLLVPFLFFARSACNQNGRRGLRKRTGCGAHRSPLSVSILRKTRCCLLLTMSLCVTPCDSLAIVMIRGFFPAGDFFNSSIFDAGVMPRNSRKAGSSTTK